MEYNAIFIDLDGTLLRRDHTISPQNLKTLAAIKEKYKIPVILISGRPPQAMTRYYAELELSTPMVSFNGSLAHYPANNQVLFESMLDIEVTQSVVDIFRAEGVLNINFFRYYEWYCNYKDKWVLHEESIIKSEAEIIDSFDQLHQKLNGSPDFHKLLGIGDEAAIQQEKARVNALDLPVAIQVSNPNYLEINTHGNSKGKTLQMLAEKFDWPLESIIAMGDGENDIEMLQTAGVSVAMANASPEVQQHARHIAPHHEEDGVSQFLEERLGI